MSSLEDPLGTDVQLLQLLVKLYYSPGPQLLFRLYLWTLMGVDIVLKALILLVLYLT